MSMIRTVMQRFYRKAEGHPERLPWHQESPPAILRKAVAARNGRGRALDVGCGAGVFSVWMAEQGMEVTGIDLFPEAMAMARERGAQHGVSPTLVQADLFTWTPDAPFDLVFDSGCLHSLVGGSVAAYKAQLLRWLPAGGDYVLAHWGKRHALDWRPIGPRRRSEETIQRIFTPELALRETEVTDFETPLPFGPVVRGVGYWFVRAG
jgi:cyclopropane fatty-acyl-phospholipid synthase-like methyltransferase